MIFLEIFKSSTIFIRPLLKDKIRGSTERYTRSVSRLSGGVIIDLQLSTRLKDRQEGMRKEKKKREREVGTEPVHVLMTRRSF